MSPPSHQTIYLSLELICEMRLGTPKHCNLLACLNVCCWQGILFRFGSSSPLLSFKSFLSHVPMVFL